MEPAQIAQAVLNLRTGLIEKTALRLSVLVEMHFALDKRYVYISPATIWSVYLQTLTETDLPEALLLQYMFEYAGGVKKDISDALEEALGKSYSIRREYDNSFAICRRE